MGRFLKCFILSQLLVQLVSVVSYTVLLKQAKSLRPSVKVLRYELRYPKLLPDGSVQYVQHKPVLGQRIYPVALKPGKEGNWKPRGPHKKEQGRQYKGGEKPASRDPRLWGLGLSQHLVPPVSNQIEDVANVEGKEPEEEVRPLVALPAQLGKSFSSFGQEKGRVYSSPGEWATPVPRVEEENATKSEFTPSQLYLQIRHKNTVIHVPQSEALKDAETLEELINAPRLKELARTTHVQETYSEEGYEDAAYDHAGHIRQAQHGEVYDAKDEGRFRIKDPPVILDYDSDLEESKRVPSRNSTEHPKDAPAAEHLSNKLEPRITRSRAEVSKTSLGYAKTPKNYKGEHIYSSRVKGPPRDPEGNRIPPTNFQATFPSYFGEMPPTPDTGLSNDSFLYHSFAAEKTSGYGNSTKIFPVAESSSAGFVTADSYTDFEPYISAIDSQASPSAKSLKYSRIYSKKTKQLRLQPYNDENVYSPPPPPPPANPPTPPHEDLQPPAEDESPDRRIVLPTIGYINSLTTAHFGKGTPQPSEKESETQLTDAFDLTQALDYLRSKKNEKGGEEAVAKGATEVDIRTFEPMKLKKSRGPSRSLIENREVYLAQTRTRRSEKEEYEGDDESDAPHDEKNEEIAEDERRRIEEERLEKEKYEEDLREEISRQEKEIVKETYKEIGVRDDISEVFPELGSPDSDPDLSSASPETTPTPVNTGKYPFYLSKRLPENSALRYATDPKQFPKKSGYKMEFYESREGVMQCPDFHPDLGDLPNSDSTEYSEEQAGEGQRIAGLGDKIACLRMKYFDPEPFDNPIFKEREIDYVGKRKYRRRLQTKSKPRQTEMKQQRPKVRPTKRPKPAVGFPVRNHAVTEESRNNPNNLPIAVQRPAKPESPRVIPVTEVLDDIPPPQPVATSSNPPVWWRRVYPSNRLVQVHWKGPRRPPATLQHPASPPKQVVVPHDCLKNISNLAVLDGTKNLTVECDDAMLFQEIVSNVARLRIIPKRANEEKEKERRRNSVPFEESDWVPVTGYSLAKHLKGVRRPPSRRTDRVTKLKNETRDDGNSSNHYMIDELKEEENVRKGEVKDETTPSEESEGEETEATTVAAETEGESSSRRRRDTRRARKTSGKAVERDDVDERVGTTDGGKLSELRRPLARLSGRDFLVRYHRNKGRATTEKSEDFWKVANKQKPQRKHAESGKPVEPGTERLDAKPVYDSQPENSTAGKGGKYKIKQTGTGRNSPLNQISEKATKIPEANALEIWKITANPLDSTQVVTKVSREMSQSTDKPRIVRKHKETTTKAENVDDGTFPTAKPEVSNQTSNPPAKESKQLSKSTDNVDGPILYYVVNAKSGRGRWITRYERRREGGARKYRKSQKPKESPEASKDKGRNKSDYEFPS